MVEKCKPLYKNVNSVKSFSEQRAATVQVMNRICENEEFLYQKSNRLEYLSPPAVRKRFNPVLVDPYKSYGYMIGHDELSTDGNINVMFDKELTHYVPLDFSDLSVVDEINSTCTFESYKERDGSFHHKAVIPHRDDSTLNTSCKNWDLEGVNSAWYCGYDKNKPYQIRPDWIINPFDSEIPSVCRAQTIVIPEGIVNNNTKSSFLEAVTLKIESQGDNHSDWSSPLYIQLWNVEARDYPRTEYKNNQNVPVGGVETVYAPKGNPLNPLATAVFNPSETTPGNFTFVFDKPVRVNAGERYAIVMLSPLSHWDHAPRIGGWGRNCKVTKDNGGDAFLSEDNGRTWIRYGRNDKNIPYKLGLRTPQDFAFQCHIRVYETGYDTENTYYLYLNPIRSNPIKSVYVHCTGKGLESNNDYNVTVQVSNDGRTWVDVDHQRPLVSFERDEITGEYPNIVFVRGVMSTNLDTESCELQSIDLTLNNELPKKMYVRTPFFNPKLTPMLGANIWGRVYAPFEYSPSNVSDVDCKVEIIMETPSKEHFHIITVDELEDFVELTENDEPIIDSDMLGSDSDTCAKYLIDNPSVVKKLRERNVYVKPYTLNDTEYLLSFSDYNSDGEEILGGLKLTNSPAYPLNSVLIQPRGTEKVESYGEHYDFSMDYESDTLTFAREVLDSIPVGALSVEYHKCFIQDLTLDEIGDRIDSETGLLEQGLILDYYNEDIFVDAAVIESRRVPLRMCPVDPLREVKILRGDDEIVLYEDTHFTVDYASHELIFKIVNVNGEDSVLQLNDTVNVVYTPALDDTGIAIGYTATRENLNHQLLIKPNFIEYK